jgi:hypothetical protein
MSRNNTKGVTTRSNSDGSTNPHYVDVLHEDKQIAGQKFACISFISPEKILNDKSLFFFEQFLKHWDLAKSMEKFTQFINYVSYKHNISFDVLNKDLEEFVKSERDSIVKSSLSDEYKTYIDNNEERLQAEFDSINKFQTSTRGIKIRGSFPTQGEAELRAKMLRESDPHHDVFVGPVGMWMPFDPEAYKTGRVEYLESELNQLMHEKNKNETRAKSDFDTRVNDAKHKAIEDNKQKAIASGNKLSQTIDDKGNLVSVKDTFGISNDEVVSTDDIKTHLFEDENVVVGETDHGLSNLTTSTTDVL